MPAVRRFIVIALAAILAGPGGVPTAATAAASAPASSSASSPPLDPVFHHPSGCGEGGPVTEGEYRGSLSGEWTATGAEFPMTITIVMEGPMDMTATEDGLLSGAADVQLRMRGEAEGLPADALALLNIDAAGRIESGGPGEVDRFTATGPVQGLLDVHAAAGSISGGTSAGGSGTASMEFRLSSHTCTTASGTFRSNDLLERTFAAFRNAGMTVTTVRPETWSATRQDSDELLERMAEIQAEVGAVAGGTRDEVIAAMASIIGQIKESSFSDAEKQCLFNVVVDSFYDLAAPAQRALLPQIRETQASTDPAAIERLYQLIRDAIAWEKDLQLLGCPSAELDAIMDAAAPVMSQIAEKLVTERRWGEALRIDRELAWTGRTSAGALEAFVRFVSAQARQAFEAFRRDPTVENAVRGIAAEKVAQTAGVGNASHVEEYCAAFGELCDQR